jgi:flagellar basal body rod protein FlgC
MFQVFAIASNALLVQGRKLEEIAAAVASTGATRPDGGARTTDGTTPVRIGALPVGDPVAPMVSLKEVELAYKMNAAVIAAADEMLDSLLDAIHPEDR